MPFGFNENTKRRHTLRYSLERRDKTTTRCIDVYYTKQTLKTTRKSASLRGGNEEAEVKGGGGGGGNEGEEIRRVERLRIKLAIRRRVSPSEHSDCYSGGDCEDLVHRYECTRESRRERSARALYVPQIRPFRRITAPLRILQLRLGPAFRELSRTSRNHRSNLLSATVLVKMSPIQCSGNSILGGQCAIQK